jgi:hypothetical protein
VRFLSTGRRADRRLQRRGGREAGDEAPASPAVEDFGGVRPDDPPVRRPELGEPPERERVRSRLALCLVALLSVVVLTSLGAVIAGVNRDDVQSMSDIVLPPVVALCGTVIGFYYASSR